KPGDCIVVSGTIGDAALGLKLRRAGVADPFAKLAAGERAHLAARYLTPIPRTGLAAGLRAHASAAMDISDGLAGDLAKLCRASNVSASIDVSRVPLSPAARSALRASPGLIEWVLTGGDDYEILCTLPMAQVEPFRNAASAAGIPVTQIGAILAGTAP